MKRFLSLSAALAVVACAPDVAVAPPLAANGPVAGAAGGSFVTGAGQVVLTGRRGFAAAELAYITAAQGVGKLVDRGMIRGAVATRVQAWNAAAGQLIMRGKATADAAEQARIAVQLFGIADNLDAVTAGGK